MNARCWMIGYTFTKTNPPSAFTIAYIARHVRLRIKAATGVLTALVT